ncbi:MAG: phosphomannomutase/phosphoglucomutase [Candidatus Pacebacteria bacterium]|nr:phosphomannomutase/phosphoglucomutase [Candidatus Paceibacterota bacterium]
MRINLDIFRAYDIRGRYPGEINEEIAYKIGLSFAEFIRRKRRAIKKLDILVGQDNRLSSPVLFKGITEGIMNSGVNVVSLGICTAPMFYFASQHYRFDDAGLMITASHLPKVYNGFKLSREVPFPIDSQTGLSEIKKMVISAKKTKLKCLRRGKLIRKSILNEYLKFIIKEFNSKKISPLKVIIDTGNAPTGIIIPEIFKKKKIRIFHLFPKLNSNFPNRSLDCTKEKNLKKLKEEVLKRKADLGVAFDGDGDRIVFLNEKGSLVQPSIISALISSILLKEHPNEKILYTINQSKIVPETIRGAGGKAIIWKVGHSNIKRKMRKENILFGGETSAHFYYREHYFVESPFFVLFKILEELSKTKKMFSELIKPFQKYYNSGELNFKVKNKKKVIKTLENKFKGGKILKMDGLRVDFPDWWFNVRPSHTESLVRLVVEAKTKELMRQKTHLLSNFLHG